MERGFARFFSPLTFHINHYLTSYTQAHPQKKQGGAWVQHSNVQLESMENVGADPVGPVLAGLVFQRFSEHFI